MTVNTPTEDEGVGLRDRLADIPRERLVDEVVSRWDAMERLLSTFGSRHRVTRRFILVDGIAEIDPGVSSAPVVQAHFGTSGTPSSAPKAEEE